MNQVELKQISNGLYDAIQTLIHDNVLESELSIDDSDILDSILKSLNDVEDYFKSLKEE